MKRLSITALAALALGLSATASADTIWSIGAQDGGIGEFSFGKGFGGTADNGCDSVFVVGTTVDADFPYELRSSDASTTDGRYSNSCETVTIQFELSGYVANPTFNFWRMGGEQTDIYLGDEFIETVGPDPVVDPKPSTLYPVSLGDYLAPGIYTLKVDGVATPGADGYHFVDYLELVADPIDRYTKFSGRHGLLNDDSKSKAPLYTFQGFFYEDPSSMKMKGSADVNYKEYDEVCTFEAVDSTVWQLDENYTNVPDTIAVRIRGAVAQGCSFSGTANIVVVDRDALRSRVSGCVGDLDDPWSERGGIKVNTAATGAGSGTQQYDIFTDGGDTEPCPNSVFDPVKLDKGNAFVVDYD